MEGYLTVTFFIVMRIMWYLCLIGLWIHRLLSAIWAWAITIITLCVSSRAIRGYFIYYRGAGYAQMHTEE